MACPEEWLHVHLADDACSRSSPENQRFCLEFADDEARAAGSSGGLKQGWLSIARVCAESSFQLFLGDALRFSARRSSSPAAGHSNPLAAWCRALCLKLRVGTAPNPQQGSVAN
jgi:hypothetical protein